MKSTNLKKLLSDFAAQQAAYFQKIDGLFEGTYPNSSLSAICSVDAIGGIFLPLFIALKEYFPLVYIPDKTNYGLEGGYYKIKIGDQAIGGFSYPEKGWEYLVYTPFTQNPGKRVNYKISHFQELVKIIQNQLKEELFEDFLH